jgi:hypothetical protein
MIAYDRSRPIIFLDIDGVLNRCGNPHGVGRMFEPECVHALKWAIEKTNAAIVLSSSWRYMTFDSEDSKAAMTLTGFEYLLKTHGLSVSTAYPLVVGATASDEDTEFRHNQITEWVRRNRQHRWLAIDDMQLEISEAFFVKTEGGVGLTIDNAIEVVRKLGVAV